MAEKAYKLKADASFPFVLRRVVTVHGETVDETEGRSYDAGDYIFDDEMTARNAERAESGDLDHLLEEVDVSEAEEARNLATRGLFIPEHEVERYALLDGGHDVIEKDQVLELRSAGAEAYAAAQGAVKESGADARPAITEQPSFQEVSSIADADPVLPVESKDPVPDNVVEASGVEMPPGLPVGPTLAKAEGADPAEVDSASEKAEKKPARKRPGGHSGSHSSSSSDEQTS